MPAPACAAQQAGRCLSAFPSYGFLLGVEPERVPTVSARFAALGVEARVVAELRQQRTLDVRYGAERARYWDLEREAVMGFGPLTQASALEHRTD